VHKAVPVLIHNGRPVCESQVIMQYLDDAFPGVGPSLLPADPYERAVARFWAAFVEDKLLAPWGMVLRAKTDEERAEWTRQTVAAVGKLEEGLRECTGEKGSFFGGERVGYVDVLLGGVVPWVRATEKLSGDRFFDAGDAPLLAAWMERFGELDAAKAVFQDVDALVVTT
jgi:glutathione S-transferase